MSGFGNFSEINLSLPEDGLDDVEFEKYMEDGDDSQYPISFKKRISGMVGEAVDYIETACSLLDIVHPDYNEICKIVTGGAIDGWYPSSLPVPSPPYFGAMMCFGPMMPFPVQTASVFVSTNPMNMPSPAVSAPATQVDSNIAVVQQTEAPVAGDPPAESATNRTPLRAIAARAACFQPASKKAEPTAQTSLMLRNIPQGVTRSMVMHVLQCKGLADHIAFIYLPMNLRKAGNFGYALVDFHCAQAAEQCKEKLEGFTDWCSTNEMALEVVWSETQGLDAFVQRYRDSPLMHDSLGDELKPALFKNGVRIAFPPPTKHVRAPRLRKTADRNRQ